MESLSPDEIKTIVKEIHECEAVIEKSKICSGMQMEREKAKKAKRFLVKKLPAGFDYASAYKEYYKEAPDNYRYREDAYCHAEPEIGPDDAYDPEAEAK